MRRLLFGIVIVFLLIVGLDRWTTRRIGRHEAESPVTFTPAAGPGIDLKDVPVLSAMDRDFTKLVAAVVPSVVTVSTSRTVERQIIDPFEQLFGIRRFPRSIAQKRNALGSGVIVSKEGHVLTNYHVVADVDEVKVQLHDGRIFPATVIGSDEQTDMAVLRIHGTGFTPLALGDSDQVKVGQMVFAVGDPFGLQREAVTRGIISGKNGEGSGDNEFFQTDAAINPGNSGGPLVDLRGEVVGINSSIYTGSGGWQGIGFAIPSNVARHVLESLLRHGGYLGARVSGIVPEEAEELGLSGTQGALVIQVLPGSPAEKGGLKAGDVIRTFDGKGVDNAADLSKLVAGADVGAKVELGLVRGSKPTNEEVTIEEKPANLSISNAAAPIQPQQQQQQQPQPPPQPNLPPATGAKTGLDGIAVEEIPQGHLTDLPENVSGVMVSEVDPESAAADWLQPGDVIEEINRQPIHHVEDFQKAAEGAAPEQKQLLSICRGRARSFVLLKPSGQN